jgi:murein DD-endopeptidase MepM/ murein hydrolase activator NlpD
MHTWWPRAAALPAILAVLVMASPAQASRNAGVAALQVALHTRGFYGGTIDGIQGPVTTKAIKRFQHRHGLRADGIVGAHTRKALGRYGRHLYGSRRLTRGNRGWDVTALQFVLAWHGFPSATFDGVLGFHTQRALRRFQRWAGLTPDGVAGPGTFAALGRPPPSCPIALEWPIDGSFGNGFGPRGYRFHAGVDLLAPLGAPVKAAAPGRVVFAGFADGFGNLVVVAHSEGVQTMYAHLSGISARPGDMVGTGAQLGAVGATGNADGPHLHFEVRVRGAAVDPMPALVP